MKGDDRKLIVRLYQMDGQAFAEVAEWVPPEYADATCKGYNEAAAKGFVYVVAPNDAACLMVPLTRRPGALPGGGNDVVRVMKRARGTERWFCIRKCSSEQEAIGVIADRTALSPEFIVDELRHDRVVETEDGSAWDAIRGTGRGR